VLLPGAEDEAIWRYFASLGFPSEEQVRQVLAVLSASPGPMSTAALEAHVDLRRTRLETMLKVLDVDGAVHRVQGGWTATGQPWAYDADRYARVSADRAAEQQAMREYAATDDCRMLFLRRQLDDPEVLDGARAAVRPVRPVHGGRCRPRLARRRSRRRRRRSAVPASRSSRARCGHGAERGQGPHPRRPAGGVRPRAGTAVRRRLGHPAAHGLRGPDAEVPDDVVARVVQVLKGWAWENRPDRRGRRAVPVAAAARRLPRRAHRLRRAGCRCSARSTWCGTPRPGGRSNSAQRLRGVRGAFAVPAGWSLDGGPVLLVDDRTDSGWTLTEAARVLREAGAGDVLPLVLAVDG
jgi:ATP-dependent DNA helicase RecQ